MSSDHRPLSRQLKMANAAQARYAVILGEKESRAGTVTLRRLSDGHQEELALATAVERLTVERGAE